MNLKNQSCLIILFVGILFSGCLGNLRKDKDINYETLAEDAALSEKLSEDLFKVVDEESKNGEYSDQVGKHSGVIQYRSLSDTCAIVTFDFNNGNFPMYLTVDFGSGCTDAYGVERRGKVIIEYTDRYENPGAEVNVSVDNYFVNNYQLEGNKKIINDGRNSNGNLQFTVQSQNVVITKPNGDEITWSSQRVNEWIVGENTDFWSDGVNGICDDTYLITGSGGGVTSDGQAYQLDIVDPLRKQICCYWINDGSIKFTVNNNELATLDYGNGSCDNNANLNYNGNSYVIVIQ